MYFWEATDAQVSSLRFYSPPLVAADFKQSIADFTVSTFLPRSHQASRGSATINAIQGPCCCMKHGLARGWWCQGLSPAGFHKVSSALHVCHAQSSNLSVRGMHPWGLAPSHQWWQLRVVQLASGCFSVVSTSPGGLID